MAIPVKTLRKSVTLQLNFVGAGTQDLKLAITDDSNPNAVSYPAGPGNYLNQRFSQIAVHNLTASHCVYSLEPTDAPVPVIGGGHTMKTVPAGALVKETPGFPITRVRIVADVAGDVEVILYA